MICIDMNTGDESAGSNDTRTYSRKGRNGLDHGLGWKSYDPEPLSSDQDSTAVPKFEVDPQVPLETMVTMDQSDQSESDHGLSVNSKHNTGLIIGKISEV